MDYPKLGDKLPNGAVVIAAAGNREGECTILAHNEDEGAYQPYVTWHAWVWGTPPRWACESGHYYVELVEAAIDFYDRSGNDVAPLKEFVDGIVSHSWV